MLEDANRDIQRLCQEDLRRRWRQQQLDRVVHAIDDLLFQLEDLNLQGVDRVPATQRERAGQILDAVPSREEYESLRVRYRVVPMIDRKSTRLNSSHSQISYAVFCLKKKNDFD